MRNAAPRRNPTQPDAPRPSMRNIPTRRPALKGRNTLARGVAPRLSTPLDSRRPSTLDAPRLDAPRPSMRNIPTRRPALKGRNTLARGVAPRLNAPRRDAPRPSTRNTPTRNAAPRPRPPRPPVRCSNFKPLYILMGPAAGIDGATPQGCRSLAR